MLDSVLIGGVPYRLVKEHVEKLLASKPSEIHTTRYTFFHNTGEKDYVLRLEVGNYVKLTTRPAFIDPSHTTTAPVQIGACGYYCGTAMSQQEADVVVTWLISKFWPTAEVL